MSKCPVCGKIVRKPNYFSPIIHPEYWKMKVVDRQRQGTLDDIFNIQPEEEENEKQSKK